MSSNRKGRFRQGAGSFRRLNRKFLDYALSAVVLGLFIAAVAWFNRVDAWSLNGKATINDGDTLTIDGQRIRLIGIDAPEYDQTCLRNGEKYACGKLSREALGRLIGGRSVTCTGSERDQYDRLLGACSAGGEDINKALVAQGWAVSYGDYFGEEKAARAGRVGLWAGQFDQPRDWRKKHRNNRR